MFLIKGPTSLSLLLSLRCYIYDLNFHVKHSILKLFLQIWQILSFVTVSIVSKLFLHGFQSCIEVVPSLCMFLFFLEI